MLKLLQYIRKKIEKLFYNQDQFTEEKPSTIEGIIHLHNLYVIDWEKSETYGINIYVEVGSYSSDGTLVLDKNREIYLKLRITNAEETFLYTKDTALPKVLLDQQSLFKPKDISLNEFSTLPKYVLDPIANNIDFEGKSGKKYSYIHCSEPQLICDELELNITSLLKQKNPEHNIPDAAETYLQNIEDLNSYKNKFQGNKKQFAGPQS